MAKTLCFNVLKDIEKSAREVTVSNDSRLREIFEMTIAGDQNRLENAKKRCNEALVNYETWEANIEAAKNKLTDAEMEFQNACLRCEQLQNRMNTSTTSLQSLEKPIKSIAEIKEKIEICKEATGVRFALNSPKDVVVGYVSIKGEVSQDSKLLPFVLRKSDILTDEVWEKISEAAEDNLLLEPMIE